MRRMRRALVPALALIVLALGGGDAAVDLVRFHGGRFGHEPCAGVLLTPSVVLTTAHCAANTALDVVTVITAASNPSSQTQDRDRASERSAAVRYTRIQPAFGVDHPLRNGVALLFLVSDQNSADPQRSASDFKAQALSEQTPAVSTALLPTSSSIADTTFLDIQVRTDRVVSAPAANFSRQACAGSPLFNDDASVWCLRVAPRSAAAGSGFSSAACSNSDETALGSPVLAHDSDERLVVVGLRLTSSCAEDQAFAYIPNLLDFVQTHLVDPNQQREYSSSLTFSSETAAAAVGKVSAARELLPPTVPSSSRGAASSSSSEDEIILPGASLRGSRSSNSHSSSSEEEISELTSGSGEREPAATLIGGWTALPSLGNYSSFAALIVHNTTEEMSELQGCLGVLVAPRFLVADAQCMASMGDPQVVVLTESERSGRSDGATQPPLRLYDVSSVTFHDEYTESVALIELSREISGMTPVAISRSLPTEYHVTDSSWEIVSMDNLFASERADRSIEVKTSLVRLPPSTCNAQQAYEGPPVTLCIALGSERDREEVFAFSQGFVLHNKQLVALPQCYSAICLSGLFQDATFVAAREDWIRKRTKSTALWGSEPIDTTATADLGKGGPDDSAVASEGSTYAVVVAGSSNGTAVCNGVLIAPRFVLTTATCVVNATTTHVQLRLDQRASEPSVEDTLTVRAVHIHPEFGTAASSAASDLALIELVAMSFFLPVLLASNDMLQVEPAVGNTSNSSMRSESDVETTILDKTPRSSYAWRLSVSPTDSSLLCNRVLPPPDQLSSAADTSSSTDMLATEVIACSLLRPQDPNSTAQGAGLIAAFSNGNTLLGISSPRYSRSACSSISDTTDLQVTCFIRVAIPSTQQFINTVSVGHRWRSDATAAGFSKGPSAFEDVGIPSSKRVVPTDDDAGYTGNLDFDSLPTNAQVGFVVGLRKGKSGQNFCGGSLIAPSYVLTAAHCVVGGEAQYVAVGSRDSTGAKAELIPIKRNKVIVHPSYGKRSSISYDVAIVELESQAYPAPIQLDNALHLDATTRFTLLGYGANSAASASLSPILRSVQLPFFDRESCRKYFPELDASMLCAGGEPARDACTGDSGSPLVYYPSGMSSPVLVGVVSTGRNGCGTPGVPGIYGFVSEMQAFISSYAAGYTWLDPNKAVDPLTSEAAMRSNSEPQSGSPSSVTGLRSSLDEYVGDDTPFEIIHSATGEDSHQLSVVKLAGDTPDLLQDAVKTFLLGEYSTVGGAWERTTKEIRSAETSITFYSSGDMTELLKTIARHRAKPLYQRSARFGKRTDPTEERHKCCDDV